MNVAIWLDGTLAPLTSALGGANLIGQMVMLAVSLACTGVILVALEENLMLLARSDLRLTALAIQRRWRTTSPIRRHTCMQPASLSTILFLGGAFIMIPHGQS